MPHNSAARIVRSVWQMYDHSIRKATNGLHEDISAIDK